MKKISLKDLLMRKKDSHKGNYGHTLVIAGSKGMTGAAVLCGFGALRSGAGLVTVAVPESIQSIVAANIIEAMTLPLPETSIGTINETSIHPVMKYIEKKKINSIVMGPGLGLDLGCRMVVISIINRVQCRGVLDADCLNQLADNVQILKHTSTQWIITPHPGELARLMKVTADEIQKKRIYYAEKYAKESGTICVLKGFQTIVTNGKKTVTNTTGNPGMATGGSGDILSGMIGGLLAQGLTPFEAAQYSVYVHGLAGDLAAADKTETSLIARDILDYVPAAFKKGFKK
ncbi:MAG: NAD(P)H-hydrate dehydratase [bacterium]